MDIELTICIKVDLALKNLQGLICYKTQKKQPTNSQDSINRTICWWVSESADWISCKGVWPTHTHKKNYVLGITPKFIG